MRAIVPFLFCFAIVQFMAGRVSAHTEIIGPLLVVEKTYGAPAPIGRIVVRYDATDAAKPKLHLFCNLFKSDLPAKVLLGLPRPNWDGLEVPYSLTSLDSKTRKFVERPYLFISVPLLGTPGKSWPSTHIQFHFDSRGQLAERNLKQFVPIKDRRPRMDLSPAAADYIAVIYEKWPLDSSETAEAVLARALKKLQPS